MKFLKWFGLAVLIIIVLYLFSDTGPIRSAYYKKILENDPIVSQLNANCNYSKPSRFIETSNPSLDCLSINRLNETEQIAEISRLQHLLESNGWRTTEKYNPKSATLLKDKFRFNVQPYYWEPGIGKDQNPKLIIYFGYEVL